MPPRRSPITCGPTRRSKPTRGPSSTGWSRSTCRHSRPTSTAPTPRIWPGRSATWEPRRRPTAGRWRSAPPWSGPAPTPATRTSPGRLTSPARPPLRGSGRAPRYSSPPGRSRCGPPSSATGCWRTWSPSGPQCWPTPAAHASASGTARTSTKGSSTASSPATTGTSPSATTDTPPPWPSSPHRRPWWPSAWPDGSISIRPPTRWSTPTVTRCA